MRTYLECVPCFMDQALRAARMATPDPALHEAVLRDVASRVASLDLSRTPPEMGRVIHAIVRRVTGNDDPYAAIKRSFTDAALEILPELQGLVDESRDRFETAVRVAIAGNIIDLGSHPDLRVDDLRSSLEDALRAPLDPVGLERLRELCGSGDDVLYIGDNAGETVFDRVLLAEIPADRLTYAVRGRPVINDATRADAVAAGIDAVAEIMDSGGDAPGTLIGQAGEEFLERFHQADCVIAKGQGNYETLSGAGREVVFLLRVKCPVIARDVGATVGDCLVRPSP